MNFTNKDQLARYMITGHVHLSKKDYGFFNNVVLQVHSSKQVTSNQNKLFDKLLGKYKRQLSKLNHDVEALVQLEWKLGIVESKKEFLEARISIVGDEIVIKSPFNTQFVQNFRRIQINPFVWDPVHKSYKGNVSTYSLNLAHTFVTRYYKDVVYCDKVQSLLNQIQEYSTVKFWKPTLVKLNDRFYIVAMNESLANAISNIELNDDPKTLFHLSLYGICFDSTVINNDPVKTFACSHDVSYDLDDLDNVIDMLKLLEVDHVITSRTVVYNKSLSNEIRLKLLEKGVTCSPQGSNNDENIVLFTTNSSFAASFSNKIAKVIHLSNSRPVKIR